MYVAALFQTLNRNYPPKFGVIARNEAISCYGNKDCFTLKHARNDNYKKSVNGRNEAISISFLID